MSGVLYAPKQRSPLWAKPDESRTDFVSLKWTVPAAILLVGLAIFGISKIDSTLAIKVIDRQAMKAVHVSLPLPVQEEKKEEVKPQAPKPTPKPVEKHQKIKPITPKKIPAPESKQETASVPMDAPLIQSGTGPSIPAVVGEPQPPPQKNVAAGSVQKGVVPLKKVNPTYPPKALQEGITGSFIIHFLVSSDGTVTDCAIISGSPRNVFQKEIKRACTQWKFEANGVEWTAELPLDFVLKDQ
ncbi:MAG: TonB family protein [Pseudomonadota bacterium]